MQGLGFCLLLSDLGYFVSPDENRTKMLTVLDIQQTTPHWHSAEEERQKLKTILIIMLINPLYLVEVLIHIFLKKLNGNVIKQTSIMIFLAVGWTKGNSTLHVVQNWSWGEGRWSTVQSTLWYPVTTLCLDLRAIYALQQVLNLTAVAQGKKKKTEQGDIHKTNSRAK